MNTSTPQPQIDSIPRRQVDQALQARVLDLAASLDRGQQPARRRRRVSIPEGAEPAR